MGDSTSFNTYAFLCEYEKFPCLWNKEHPKFKDRLERHNAQAILMEKTGINDVMALRKKIRSIRGTYNNEIRKIKQSQKSGSNTVYIPKLLWFEVADRFLGATTYLFSDSVLEIQQDEDEIEDDSRTDVSNSDGNETCSEKPYPSCSTTDVPCKKKLKLTSAFYRNHKLDEEVQLNKSRTITEISPHGTNEFLAFGNSVGMQLTNMPLELAVQLQSDIQTLITRRRLNYIRKTSESSLCSRTSSPTPPVQLQLL